MHHFFAEAGNIAEDSIRIVGDDVNHIKNVLRMKAGDGLMVSSGDNQDYNCHIEEISDSFVVCHIDSLREKSGELSGRVHLYQGLPKGDKMEFIIQKMVELGCASVVPVAMKRSVVKLDAKKAEAKVKRWNTIAESAAEQSKRSLKMPVRDLMSFKEAVQDAGKCDKILVPYECAEGMSRTKTIIESLKTGQDIAVFIGPEGGFDESEIEALSQADGQIITLGNRILRTETAGMMLMSVLMYYYELLDLKEE